MDLTYWKRFEQSGKIEDYLSFVSNGKKTEETEEHPAKEDGYAGVYMGNGDHTETGAGGGV